MYQISQKGGLIICIAPFSWRFHPSPSDYFRYTHKGLEYLFTKSEEIETIFAGYDISDRRLDHRGGCDDLGLERDNVPIDKLGGWREHWLAVFVGKKIK